MKNTTKTLKCEKQENENSDAYKDCKHRRFRRRLLGHFLQFLIVVICMYVMITHYSLPQEIESTYTAMQKDNIDNAKGSSMQETIPAEDIEFDENFKFEDFLKFDEDSSDEKVPSTSGIEEYSNAVDEFEQERENEGVLDESIRPKGSKLVSIPSIEVDALRNRRSKDDRFIVPGVFDVQEE